MLNLSGDSAGDIQFGAYSNAGLSHLTVVIGESRIDGSTRCAYFGMQFFGKIEQQLEVLFRADAVTAGDNNRRAFQVVLRLFDSREIGRASCRERV